MHEGRRVVVEFGREVPPRSFGTALPAGARDRRIVVDPLRHPDISRRLCGIDEQVAHWANHVGQADAVLGYCTGAGLAAGLAARIMPNGGPLILFDPVLPTMTDAQALVTELAIGMDESLDGGEVPDLTGMTVPEAYRIAGGFLHSVMRRSGGDIPVDLVDTLTEQQRVWVAYTLAAVSFGAGARIPDHVFLSADADWPADPRTRVHRFDADAVGLFHSAEVTAGLAAVLAEEDGEVMGSGH